MSDLTVELTGEERDTYIAQRFQGKSDREKFAELWASEKTQTQIAEFLGMSQADVSELRKFYGLPAKPRGKRGGMTPEEKRQRKLARLQAKLANVFGIE